MREKIVFIESSDIGVEYSARAAELLGYEPVFLCDLADYQGDPRSQLLARNVIDGDTSSIERVIELLWINSIAQIAGVISFADSRIAIACGVALKLGVRGLDPAVVRLKNKAGVADMIPESSPPSIAFHDSEIPVDALKTLLAQAGKLLLKPVAGAGGLGATVIETEAELEDLQTRMRNHHVPSYMGSGHWIAQTFISGPLYSCEGFVCGGATRVLGFTDRRKIGSTETGAKFPVDAQIPAALRDQATEAITNLFRRSEFRSGYFHIEFLHDTNTNRLTLIDANIGRVGGGAIAQQLAIAYRLPPEKVFAHVLGVTLFSETWKERDPYSDSSKVLLDESFAILYGIAEHDTLESVTINGETTCYHTQILGRGASVMPMGTNDWSWIGILCGRTEETLKTVQNIHIMGKSGEHQPCY